MVNSPQIYRGYGIVVDILRLHYIHFLLMPTVAAQVSMSLILYLILNFCIKSLLIFRTDSYQQCCNRAPAVCRCG